MSLYKDAEERAIAYAKLKRKAARDWLAELYANVEERDKWVLGLNAGKEVPKDLKIAYSMFTMCRDSYPKGSDMWKILNVYVEDLKRDLDYFYDIPFRLYNQALEDEIAAETDTFGAIDGMPEGGIFSALKKKFRKQKKEQEEDVVAADEHPSE